MEETTKTEQASGRGPSLEVTAQRLTRWREVRRRGEHVPPALWAAAVELAEAYGVRRIADELGLDVDRLNKRVAEATPAGEAGTQFVEMFATTTTAPAVDVRECVVEVHNARGATMRVELAGSGLAALADLCSAFCGAR